MNRLERRGGSPPRERYWRGSTRRARWLLAVLVVAAPLAALEVPYLSGRLNDRAGLLDEASRQRIEAKLAALESETGAQMAVLSLESLEGEPLEEFSLRVAETWGLGRAAADDGVLLLISRDDRKMRLEVGYGLEGRLPDVVTGRILDRLMAPRFRRGDYSGGIEAAIDAVGTAIRGEPLDLPSGSIVVRTVEAESWERWIGMGIFTVVVGTFSLIAVLTRGCGSWFLYLFLMPFYAAFPAAFGSGRAGLVLFGTWLLGFPLLKQLLDRTGWGKRFVAEHPGWTPTWSSSRGWSSGGGGGLSSGGFSGGGGSFGGGGASGSW